MAAFETVPADTDWAEDPDEFEEWLVDVFDELARSRPFGPSLHDRDSTLHALAGTEDCLALGHAEPGTGTERDAWEDLHPEGWNRQRICKGTYYGKACSFCEDEHCPEDVVPLIWELPGVTAEA